MKDFEKYIQQKAGSFQMDPMPDSFDKVMAALEKKKKRRFIFWLWLLIPGFVIGGTIGIYTFFLNSENKTIVQQQISNGYLNSNKNEDIYSITAEKENITSENDTTPTNTKNNEWSSIKTRHQNSKHEHQQDNQVVKKDDSTKNSLENNTDHTQKNNTQNILVTNIENNDHQQKRFINQVYPLREKQIFVVGTNNYSVPVKKGINPYSQDYSQNIVPIVQTSPHELIIKPRSKFSLGIYSDLGVSKSSFYSEVPVDSTYKGYYTTARSSADKFLFSYSAGLQFRYSPLKFLSIETGVAFTHYESYQVIVNSGVTTSSLVDQNEPDTVLSFASYNSPSLKEYYNTYDYISIPIKLFYQNRWNKIGIETGGGIIFDIPVNTRSYAANENTGVSYLKKQVKGSRLNMFGIQAVANVNLVFYIGKFSLFGGPTFKYRLNSMFDDQYIMQQRPFFIGGQIGVRYNF